MALILAGKYPSVIDRIVVWGGYSFLTKHDMDLREAIRDVSQWNAKMRQRLEGECDWSVLMCNLPPINIKNGHLTRMVIHRIILSSDMVS